jgi:hypothetical protein
MLGTYEAAGDIVRFRPRFPLVPGLSYRVRFDRGARQTEHTRPVEATVLLPAPRKAQRTEVAAVFPGGGELAANHLKFYVCFSAPMTAGEARERVHLLDEQGREVPGAFLWLEQELWDRSRQRLTLILDPGRVKRGLRANREEGAPLQAGHSYRLLIDGAWPDGEGVALRDSFRKEFRVIEADRRGPDRASWRLTAPASGTTDAVELRFDEPLDYALLHEMIDVRDAHGTPLDGTVQVDEGERAWRFRPARPWSSGRHAVRVGRDLEDRSGNDLERPFDLDLHQAPASPPGFDWVELPFAIRHGG